MSNLREKRNISRWEAFVPKRGHLSVRTGQPRKHPQVKSNAADWDRSSGDSREKPSADGRRGRRPSEQMILPGFGSSGLNGMTNPRFTFAQFVVGPGNRFAYAAAWAVANDKRNGYNPLFLYAQSGMGKSHLSCAIGNHILATRPSTRILYATAEEFSNEMVSGIQKKEMAEFKEKYRRRCDILFVDGVHFFSGKKATQAEISHTFDHLYNAGKRIILTGSSPPHEISHMTDGLKSRLAGGLVVDIHPPDLETRRRILHQKAEFDGAGIPEDVVDLLAHRVSGSIRRLEGLVVNLIAKSSLLYRPIDLELAQDVLASFQVREKQRITIETIQKLAAKQYHIQVEQLTSRSRRRSICYPRQVSMYLCRKFTTESLDAIGKAYHRDHASVIHAIGVIERQIREKVRVRREVEFLVDKLKSREGACD